MLIGMMLVRNESGRWLETVLEQMFTVCDKMVFIDDASTDETPKICLDYATEYGKFCRILHSQSPMWSNNEVALRKGLWDMAIKLAKAKPGDWILCLDADETIPNIELLPEKIKQAEEYGCNGISFNLYDMWSPTHYREDVYWNAHYSDWVMCVRYDAQKEYIWREQGLHCGRFPQNAYDKIGQTGLKIQHWGWSRPEDRAEKYQRYMKADPEGKFGVLKQYQSILDPSPNLRRFD